MERRKQNINTKCRALAWLLLLIFSIIPITEAFHHHVNDQKIEKLSNQSKHHLNIKVANKQCVICNYIHAKETKQFYSISDFVIAVKAFIKVSEYFTHIHIYLSKDKLLFYGKSPPQY